MTENTGPLTLAENGKQEYGKGNYKAAAGLFSQAAGMYASLDDELNAAEMKNNESVALLQAGEAKEAFERAVAADARNPEPLYYLGAMAVSANDTATAIQHLEKYIATGSPQSPNYATAKGLLDAIKPKKK